MFRLASHRVRKIKLDLECVQKSAEDPLKIASDLSTAVVKIIATSVQEQLGELSDEGLILECRNRIFHIRRESGGRL